MKSKVVYWVLAGLVILTLVFNGANKKYVRPRGLSKNKYEELVSWVNDNCKSPEDYLVGLYDTKDIVCLGTDHSIADGIKYLNEMVPVLHAKGINTIAVDFLLARDQSDIDKLVAFDAASESLDGFDEKMADQLLFNYVVLFGYKEYVDLLYTVWQLNSSLQPDEQKMKIAGLAAYQDFSYLQTEDNWDDHDLIRKIIPDQNTMDSFMGKTAINILLDQPGKSLVFSEVPQAFTAFRQKGFEKHTEDLGYPLENSKRMGNYIYEKAGDRVATVLVHTFFPDRKSYEGVNYPLGGILEKVDRGLDNINKRYAFTVEESPFADMEITGEYAAGYAENKETVYFKDLTYGYIFLNSIKQAELVTPIDGFINDRNVEAARKNFPGPKDVKWSVNQLNGYINGYLGRYAKIKKLFI